MADERDAAAKRDADFLAGEAKAKAEREKAAEETPEQQKKRLDAEFAARQAGEAARAGPEREYTIKEPAKHAPKPAPKAPEPAETPEARRARLDAEAEQQARDRQARAQRDAERR